MKKIIPFILVAIFLTSCGTPGRVCGGKGGRRCVEVNKKTSKVNYSEVKRNS